MLKLTGTICECKDYNTKKGVLKVYRIADVDTYRVTDFSGSMGSYEIGDRVTITVRAKVNIYNEKAYIQYVC